MPSIIRGVDEFDSLESQGLGDGQTWQDMTASRASGVTYTNSTGRPIKISASASGNPRALIVANVGGVEVSRNDSTRSGVVEVSTSILVQNGVTYSFDIFAGSLSYWKELR